MGKVDVDELLFGVLLVDDLDVALLLFVEHSQHWGVGLDEGAAEAEPSSFLGRG